jgi:hypothetical protein
MRIYIKDKSIYEGQARSNQLWICHDFATVHLALIRFRERIRDFSSRDVSFYAAKAVDTVGVCGSNPHSPTNVFNH